MRQSIRFILNDKKIITAHSGLKSINKEQLTGIKRSINQSLYTLFLILIINKTIL